MIPRHVKVVFLIALMTLGAIGLGVLGSQVRNELQLLRSASSDNVQWNLSQLEVELVNFELALERTHHQAAANSLKQLRRRFDVLYSRTTVLTRGVIYKSIQGEPGAAADLAKIKAFLDETVPIIDGPDDQLLANVHALAERAAGLHEAARNVAINGINIFAVRSTEQRALLSSLLTRTSLLSLSMIIALAVMLGFLIRQYGVAERESQKRKLTNTRLNSVIGTSLDAIVVVNRNGMIIDFNGAATEVFGYTRDEVLGEPAARKMLPERAREAYAEGMTRYLETGEGWIVGKGLVEMTALHKDGHEFPVEVSVAASEGQNAPIFVAFVRDISARLIAQAELTAARDEALAANKAKSEFLAVMSHEMRTPLNGLMGTLDLLAASELTKKQRQYVEVGQTSGNFLLRHINDVLDISKVEADKLGLSDDVFSPTALAEEVAQSNRILAAASGNTISVETALPPEFQIIVDRFRVSQTLLNLVGNAIKFTSHGSIRIVVTRLDVDQKEMIEFRVMDTGIGIAEENLAEIFDDFVTIDTSYSRRADGTGLGLGISRRMAKAMGGEIGVESTLGEGSSFWFRFPLRVADTRSATSATDAAGTAAAETPDRRALSILLVEDNQINRFVAREIIESLGHAVTEAHDGVEGVALAEHCPFDMILMDISMPVMDGVAATRAIRASDGKSAKTVIVGLTAHALPGEIDRFLEAGMQECMTKPIDARKLRAMLDRQMVPEMATLDAEVTSELSDLLGEERYAAALSGFIDEMDGALPRLACDNGAGDLDDLVVLVHKLAGSAGVFGARRLSARLSELETACKSGDVQAARAQLEGLDMIWQDTRRDLGHATA